MGLNRNVRDNGVEIKKGEEMVEKDCVTVARCRRRGVGKATHQREARDLRRNSRRLAYKCELYFV